MKCLTNPLWYEIVVADLLSGQFVANFLNFVVLQYLEGVDRSELYRNHDSKIEELDVIIKLVNQVGQIIYGGVTFCFSSKVDLFLMRMRNMMKLLIEQMQRAVDGGYL